MKTLSVRGTAAAVLLAVTSLVHQAAIKLGQPRTVPMLISSAGFLAAAPDGRTLASGEPFSDTVALYDMHTGRARTLKLSGRMYDPPEYYMSSCSVAFSPDGHTLVDGGTPVDGARGENGSLNLWNLRTGQHVRLFAEGLVKGPAVVFSPDGKMVACGGQDAMTPRANFGRQIRFWNAANGLPLGLIHTPSLITALAFSPDGRFIATGGIVPDPCVRVWDVHSHQLLWSQRLPDNQPFVTAVQFSPNGKLLATGSQGRVAFLWDARHGKLFGKLVASSYGSQSMGLNDVAAMVAFSPNGKLLATGGIGGVNVWSVASKTQTRALNAEAPIAFLPDGKHLLTVQATHMGRNHVQVWAMP